MAPHFVLARFYEPIDRGDRYEDPLNDVLEAAGIGRVTGGGSLLTEDGRIEFADIEIELVDRDAALQAAVEALERAGAPLGSEILLDGKGASRIRHRAVCSRAATPPCWRSPSARMLMWS